MPYQRIVHVVNRTYNTVLEVMDDGIPWTIRPGYKRVPVANEQGEIILDEFGEPQHFEVVGSGPAGTVFMEPLPYFAAERAKRQNPVLGTEDPMNPNAFETLIAVPEWGDDYSPLEQSEAIERIDRSLLAPEFQNIEVRAVRGARRPVPQKGPDGKWRKVNPAGRAFVLGEAIPNPAGIRTVD
jgi:hypothetical protein